MYFAEHFVEKATEESGMGDLSILRCYEKCKERIPAVGRIMIWSLDDHLSCYNETLLMKKRRRDS